MSVKVGIGETVVNVIRAYAPQVGCEEEEKETFWRLMDQELCAIGLTRRRKGDSKRNLKRPRGDQYLGRLLRGYTVAGSGREECGRINGNRFCHNI